MQNNRSLSEFSTFGIGGPIRHFVEVRTIQEMESAFAHARNEKLEVLVIGKGSNSLFSDAPFEGLVILNRIDFCEMQEATVHVGSGYSFSLLGAQTARKGLSGLEFASGIPATVGGAIFMNAGANGKETCDSLHSVEYLFGSGEKKIFSRDELTFSYRTSPFQSMKGCILSAHFTLQPNEQARTSQLSIIDYRMKTQPLKEKSIGCIFRNPSKEVSAGSLIDQAGLKGYAVGGAAVSPIHANFIVNVGGAKAKDVLTLIDHIQKEVLEKTGYHLEPEVRVL